MTLDLIDSTGMTDQQVNNEQGRVKDEILRPVDREYDSVHLYSL